MVEVVSLGIALFFVLLGFGLFFYFLGKGIEKANIKKDGDENE